MIEIKHPCFPRNTRNKYVPAITYIWYSNQEYAHYGLACGLIATADNVKRTYNRYDSILSTDGRQQTRKETT